MTERGLDRIFTGGIALFMVLLPVCYYVAAHNPAISDNLSKFLATEIQSTKALKGSIQSYFNKDIGSISNFIIVYTIIICATVGLSWIFGGKKAVTIFTLAWNLEILLYNIYSSKFFYVVEHINLFLFMVLYFIESPADKNERALREMQQSTIVRNMRIDELQKYELILKRIFGDVSQSINQSYQHLQAIQFTWRNVIHDLKNKLTAVEYNELESSIAEKVIKPNVEIIMEYLRKLPENLDVELSAEPVGFLYQSLRSKYETNGKTSINVRFGDLSCDGDVAQYRLQTNRHRLDSIVLNVIQNSSKAVARNKNVFRENRIPFLGAIDVSFGVSRVDDNPHLEITIRDNGGGFPEAMLGEIYKKPVTSSDTSKGERFGEGTVYISRFVEFMQGKIEATNILYSDNMKGAQTRISFPLIPASN